MVVKIVTDGAADIPNEVATELGITVVPTIVRFGSVVYRDGVDINTDEFYRKLSTSTIHPSTAAPAPGEFAKVYDEISGEAEAIVSIHVTRKHSSVLEAALLGKQMAEKRGCHIEIIDSRGVTMWQGLVAIAAAKAAKAGFELQQVVDMAREAINQLRGLALLDTLRYAVKGGRLSKTLFAVESILNVKPMLTIRNAEVCPAGLVRTWSKGIERLQKFVKSIPNIEEVAVVHNTIPDEAKKMAEYVVSLFPSIVPRMARLGPTLGVHTGPGTIVVAVYEKKM